MKKNMKWFVGFFALLLSVSWVQGESVICRVDTRDYNLTVSSDHGSPVPTIGTHPYAWRSSVTCSADTSIEDGVNWYPSGWIGAGSVPTIGSTNTTAGIVLTNLESSIIWSWETSFAITNVAASQREGTKLVDVTYDIVSDLTNATPISFGVKNGDSAVSCTSVSGDVGSDVLPGVGRQITWNMGADWNGNVAELTYSVMHLTATSIASSASISSDSRDYNLTVSSAHGTPVPSVGVSAYAWKSAVTCSADASVEDGINWRPLGWTGSGSIPTAGATNITGEIILTNLESSIVWGWETSFAITNVAASQREGTKLVDITYDIVSDLTNAAPVFLGVKNGDSAVSCTSASGDVGSDVLPGVGRQITWNMGADWNGNAALLMYTVEYTPPPEGFVFVEAGTAAGGSPTILDDFYIAKFEVTKNLWNEVAGWADDNAYDISPGGGSGDSPVVNVTWYECVKWCNAWSEKTGRTPAYTVGGAIYRSGSQNNVDCDFTVGGFHLPSDMQWEYAARGGKDGSDTEYSGSDTIDDVAWYESNGGLWREVGTLEANELGTFDMSGNVWEWCNDWYRGGSDRVLRGGGWDDSAWFCRVSVRSYFTPSRSHNARGFRPAMPAVQAGCADVASEVAILFSDARDYNLTVSSAHGTPVPSIGTHPYAWRSSVTCSVDAISVEQGIAWENAGWSGSGSVPMSGNLQSTGEFVLTNVASSIVWAWKRDFDVDGVIDDLDLDDDDDGLSDADEVRLGTNPFDAFDPIQVDDDAPNDPEAGDPELSDPLEDGTRDHPYDAIQEAIDAATNGNTVVVLDGLYQGSGNRDIRPNGKEIVIQSLNGFEHTQIEGYPSSGFICDGGETAQTVIKGFSVYTWKDFFGKAGLLCDGSSPRIEDCRFWDCGEAGILCVSNAAPEIEGCEIVGNAGGIRSIDSSPMIESCLIVSNVSAQGAGLFFEGSSSAVVENCLIAENVATDEGGGVFVGAGAEPEFVHCTVAGNTAAVRGGGVSSAGAAEIVNSIVYDNEAPASAGIYLAAPLDVQYSCLQGFHPGVGNFVDDPLFVEGTYELSLGSPAIDEGSVAYGLSHDVLNLSRPLDGDNDMSAGYDLGAFEFIHPSADTDGDGVADAVDAFPLDPDEEMDTDGDGIGNHADPDDDNDGVLDAEDLFPLNGAEWADADGDGVGDNADLDDDNDGMSDWDEMVAGTSPVDDQSLLEIQLSLPSLSNGLSFFGVSGRYYQIEYTENLGGEWFPIGAVSPGGGAIISEYDVTAGEKRFYRIQVSDDAGNL